jgi:arylsulfatase A-like enzyme
MFERGEIGHYTPLLYEPLVRIPLLVWRPGRRSRQDIFARTSNVDILPTLLRVAGLEIPDWCEGRPLPGLGGAEDPSRGVFVVEAKATSANRPLRRATVALVNEDYKLIRYKGYVGRYADYYEFYELGDDREEMKNLAESGGAPKVFRRMQDELLTRWAEADRPFGGS